MASRTVIQTRINLALCVVLATWGISPALAVPVTATITGTVDIALDLNPFELGVNDTVTAVAMYDDSLVLPSGLSDIAIDSNPAFSLNLTFGELTLVETDDRDFGGGFPEIGFFNGSLSSIEFLSGEFNFRGFPDVEVESESFWLIEDQNAILVAGSWDFTNVQIVPNDEDIPPGGQPIPEPSTILLLGSGLVGLASYRWQQRRREGTHINESPFRVSSPPEY